MITAMKPGQHPFRQRTVCSNGHEYKDGSYRFAKDGSRVCKECAKLASRRSRTGTEEIQKRERGTGTITQFGYVAIAKDKKKTQEHRLIVEKALGKPIPAGAEIHHVNGIRSDNRPENLVLCPDKAYHKLIHARADAMAACGNPNYRKCPFCKAYDDPQNMKHNPSSRYFFHSKCKAQDSKSRRAA